MFFDLELLKIATSQMAANASPQGSALVPRIGMNV